MSIKSSNVQPCFGYCIQSVLILLGWCHQSSAMRRMCVLSIYILWKNSFTTRSYIFVLRSGRSVCVLSRFRRPFMRAIFVWVRLPLADCPTQLTLILSLWYLYLSVFHDKYQSYKCEQIQHGNLPWRGAGALQTIQTQPNQYLQPGKLKIDWFIFWISRHTMAD